LRAHAEDVAGATKAAAYTAAELAKSASASAETAVGSRHPRGSLRRPHSHAKHKAHSGERRGGLSSKTGLFNRRPAARYGAAERSELALLLLFGLCAVAKR